MYTNKNFVSLKRKSEGFGQCLYTIYGYQVEYVKFDNPNPEDNPKSMFALRSAKLFQSSNFNKEKESTKKINPETSYKYDIIFFDKDENKYTSLCDNYSHYYNDENNGCCASGNYKDYKKNISSILTPLKICDEKKYRLSKFIRSCELSNIDQVKSTIENIYSFDSVGYNSLLDYFSLKESQNPSLSSTLSSTLTLSTLTLSTLSLITKDKDPINYEKVNLPFFDLYSISYKYIAEYFHKL